MMDLNYADLARYEASHRLPLPAEKNKMSCQVEETDTL